ncbi:hypothetical protein BDD12DRAFT_529924 [Trichophaea hybrida]|nr:hypothetical protein BDD12DRAFT_529924 [Trichophaea hybrida]
MFSKQAFKPVGVHYYRLQATQRCNTDDDSHHSDGHSTSSAGYLHYESGDWSPRSGPERDEAEIKDLDSKMDRKFELVDRKFDKTTARLTVCCTVLSLVLLFGSSKAGTTITC